MIESFVVNLLQDYADRYLQHFDKNMLNISLSQGDVKIKDLELKQNAFENIIGCLEIMNGYIDNLQIKFSIMKLKTQPVQIIMNNFFVLLKNKQDTIINEQIIKDFLQEKLEDKIKNSINFMLLKEDQIGSSKSKTGYFKDLVKTILINLKVEINNIHIRYEDLNTNVSIGVTIKSINIETNQDSSTQGKIDEQNFGKIIRITDIASYCNFGFIPISSCQNQQQIKLFMLNTIQIQPNYNYFLKPATFSMQIDQSLIKTQQLYSIKITLSDFKLQFTTNQLSAIIQQAQVILIKQSKQNLQFYPQQKQLNADWWSYILQTDLQEEYPNILCYHTFINLYSQYFIKYKYLSNKQKEISKNDFLIEQSDILTLFYRSFQQNEIYFCIEVVLSMLSKQSTGFFSKTYKPLKVEEDQIQILLNQYTDNKISFASEDLILNTKNIQCNFLLDKVTIQLCQRGLIKQIEKTNTLPLPIGKQYTQLQLVQFNINKISLLLDMQSVNQFKVNINVQNLTLIDQHQENEYYLLQNLTNKDDIFVSQVYTQKQQLFQFSIIKQSNDQNYQLNLQIKPIIIKITNQFISLFTLLLFSIKQFNPSNKLQFSQLVKNRTQMLTVYSQNAINLAIQNRQKIKITLYAEAPIITFINKDKQQNMLLNFGEVQIIQCQTSDKQLYDSYQFVLSNVFLILSSSQNETNFIYSSLQKQQYNDKLEQVLNKTCLLYPMKFISNIKLSYLKNYLMIERNVIDIISEQIKININNQIIEILNLFYNELVVKLLMNFSRKKKLQAVIDTSEINQKISQKTTSFQIQLDQYLNLKLQLNIQQIIIQVGKIDQTVENMSVLHKLQLNTLNCVYFEYNTKQSIEVNLYEITITDQQSDTQIVCLNGKDNAIDFKLLINQANVPRTIIIIVLDNCTISYSYNVLKNIITSYVIFQQLINIMSVEPQQLIVKQNIIQLEQRISYMNQYPDINQSNQEVNFKFSLQLQSVNVNIIDNNIISTKLSIRGSEININKSLNFTDLQLTLRQFDLIYILSDTKIISFSESKDDQININIILSSISFDYSIDIQISKQIQILVLLYQLQYLNHYFTKQLPYLKNLNSINEQNKNIKQIYTNQIPVIFKCKVYIKAPYIIVPLNKDLLMQTNIDLGLITIDSQVYFQDQITHIIKFNIESIQIEFNNKKINNNFSASTEILHIQYIKNNLVLKVEYQFKSQLSLIQLCLTIDDLSLFRQYFLPQNNLGYNILDDQFYSQQEITDLENNLFQLQKQYNERSTKTIFNQVEYIQQQIESIKLRQIKIDVNKIIKNLLTIKNNLIIARQNQKRVTYYQLNFLFSGLDISIDKIQLDMKSLSLYYQQSMDIKELNISIGSVLIKSEILQLLQSSDQIILSINFQQQNMLVIISSKTVIQLNLYLSTILDFYNQVNHKSQIDEELSLQIMKERDNKVKYNNKYNQIQQQIQYILNLNSIQIKEKMTQQNKLINKQIDIHTLVPQIVLQLPSNDNNTIVCSFKPNFSGKVQIKLNKKISLINNSINYSQNIKKDFNIDISDFNISIADQQSTKSLLKNCEFKASYNLLLNQIYSSSSLPLIKQDNQTLFQLQINKQIDSTLSVKDIQLLKKEILQQLSEFQQNNNIKEGGKIEIVIDKQQYFYSQILKDAIITNQLSSESYWKDSITIGEVIVPIFQNSDISTFQCSSPLQINIVLIDDVQLLQPIIRLNSNNFEIFLIQQKISQQIQNLKLLLNCDINISHFNLVYYKWESTLQNFNPSIFYTNQYNEQQQQFVKELKFDLQELAINLNEQLYSVVENCSNLYKYLQSDVIDSSCQNNFYCKYKLCNQEQNFESAKILVYNNTSLQIQINDQVIDSLDNVLITFEQTITLVVHDFNFLIITGQILSFSFTLNNEIYFVISQYQKNQFIVSIRPKYYIQNYSQNINLIVNDQLNASYTSSQIIVISKQDNENSLIQLQIQQKIQLLCIDDYNFRLEYEKQYIDNLSLYTVKIYPTFVISNYCSYEMKLDKYILKPFQNFELFTNPSQSVVFQDVYYLQYQAKQCTFFKYIEKIPILSDQSKNAIQLRHDITINEDIYQIPTVLKLQSHKDSYYVNFKRIIKSKQNITNPFNFCILIYPTYFICNRLQHNLSQNTYDINIKTADTQNLTIEPGDYIELGIKPNSKLDIQLVSKENNCSFKNIVLGNELDKLTQTNDKQHEQINFNYKFSQQQLSKVITIYPSVIIRNNSQFDLQFCFLAQEETDVQKFITILHGSIVSQIQYKDYMKISLDSIKSSLIPFKESSEIVNFANSENKVNVQIQLSKNIFYIDIFDTDIQETLIIENLTNDLFEISQNTTDEFAKNYNQKIWPKSLQKFKIFDLNQECSFVLKCGQLETIISTNKIGKKKPIQFGQNILFIQVDLDKELLLISISHHPIDKQTILQKSTRDFMEEFIQSNIVINVSQVQLNYYQLNQNYLKQNKKAYIQLFQIFVDNLNLQIYKLEESQLITISVQQLFLYNLQNDAEFPIILQFSNQNGNAALFQIEKLNNTQQYVNINLELEAIEVNIDQSFLANLLSTLEQLQFKQIYYDTIQNQDTQIKQKIYQLLVTDDFSILTTQQNFQQLFIAYLNISQIDIILKVAIDDFSFLKNNFIFQFYSSLAQPFLNITQANIKFQNFFKKQLVTQQISLVSDITKFYKQQIKHNIGILLKSSVIQGIQSQSQQNQKSSRLMQVYKLSKNTLGSSLQNIASTVSSISGLLSGDLKFSKESQKLIRDSQKNSRHAMKNAGKALADGFIEGAIGIVKQSIIGGKEKGIGGVIAGLGKGILGIVTKPIQGIANAVQHVGIAVEKQGTQQIQHKIPQQKIFYDVIQE